MRTRLTGVHLISDADARRLLGAYLPLVKRIRASLYRRLPLDEALGVGTDAILEAFLSLDVTKASEPTWVRRVLHWRLSEAVQRLPWDHSAERLETDPQVVNGKSPEAAYVQQSAFAQLAALPPKYQMVIDGRLRGESYAEVGSSLGVSRQRAQVVGQKAIAFLQDATEQEP